MRKIIVLLYLFLSINPLHADASKKLNPKDFGLLRPSVPADKWTDEFEDRREHMLKHHRKMGHMTFGLMLLSAASAVWGVHEIESERSKRGGAYSGDDAGKLNLHMAIATATMASYYTTAYFSLGAPKRDDYEDESARVWHKRLAWVHGASMLLGPILGMLAFKDYHDGKDPEGIAKLHRPLMFAGLAAYSAAYTIAVLEW